MSQEVILLIASVLTLGVATIAAVYGFRAYNLKSGIRVRGLYSPVSSIKAEDPYVGTLTLENTKDRAVIIFGVFLEVGYGSFIEIDDFEDEPLVLQPFGAFKQRYDPIDFYGENLRRVRTKQLLWEPKTRRRLVLSTSQGRYNVVDYIDHWDPVNDFFRNHLTAIIRPYRLTHEGRAYGSGAKYLVQLVITSGKEVSIPIYERDYEIRRFTGFPLTPASLATRDALEEYLLERAVEGELQCKDLCVLDLVERRQEVYKEYLAREDVEIRPRGWLSYHILGWLVTRWDKFRLRRSNQHMNRQRQREAARDRDSG